MRERFAQTFLREAKRNSSLILVTGDLGYKVFDDIQKEIPAQFLNSGVAEQSMVGLAAGMASTGKRVFVYSIGNFPTLRALEQIRNDICYMENSVVIVAVGAGYSYGSQGYTHHALEDISIVRALPGIEILSPCDDFEAEEITSYLANTKRPAYLRLGRSEDYPINTSYPELIPGKFNKIAEGKDGLILFTGGIGSIAIQARERLLTMGKEIGVYSVPFLNKIDPAELKEVSRDRLIVTLEENTCVGGFGSLILEVASEFDLNLKIKSVGAARTNLSEIGSQNYLRNVNGLNVNRILQLFT